MLTELDWLLPDGTIKNMSDEIIYLREIRKSNKRLRVEKAKGKQALIRFFRMLGDIARGYKLPAAPKPEKTGIKVSGRRANIRYIREMTGLSLPVAAQVVKLKKQGTLYPGSIGNGEINEQVSHALKAYSTCDCCGPAGYYLVGPKGRLDTYWI